MASTTSSGQSWDDRYSEEGYAFGTEPNDFLVEVADRIPRGAVLVLGDGDGRNGVYLAECGHEVVSIDLSPVGVEKARALAASRGVSIDARVGDLATFDMGQEKWDAVVSIFCHLPAGLRADVHAGIHQALKPGGAFVLEAYNQANIGRGVGGPQSSDMTVELAEMKEAFDGWGMPVARTVERNIVEGKYHNGVSSTTQILAVRPHD